jgi:mevalonate kinase
MKRSGRVASAPAKVILFGEHFVVYGTTALLASIDRRTTARVSLTGRSAVEIRSDIGVSARYRPGDMSFRRNGTVSVLDPIYLAAMSVLESHRVAPNFGIRISLRSEVPYGIGLGSSAASCVATAAAVDSLFGAHSRNWICKKAIESEKMIHVNSSGADCYVSTFGGIIRFSMPDGFRRIDPSRPLRLVVGSTGVRHSTGELVSKVMRFRASNQSLFRSLSRRADEICSEAEVAIKEGRLPALGRLMTANQELLRKIGVSHSKAEKLIDLCLGAGALGAKITGAGGGGAVIALAATKREARGVAASLEKRGYFATQAEIDNEGLISR